MTVNELALKGMLRVVGIDPPKWHDVGDILLEGQSLWPVAVHAELPELARISRRLRKEREIAYYGEIDLIPSQVYDRDQALSAMADTDQVVAVQMHFEAA